MYLKNLSLTLATLLTVFSLNVNAGLINLIESDVYGDNTNQGYTLDTVDYNLEWLDLNVVDNFTYTQVKSGLPHLNDFRIATKNEVFHLFKNIFSDYNLNFTNTDNSESISFDETIRSRLGQTQSTYMSVFDTIGGRLRHYDWGNTTLDRFGAYFDTGDDGVLGVFTLVGHDICGGDCTVSGFGVATIKDETLTARIHEQQRLHDSTMLVREIRSVPEPPTLAIFALGIMGLASRRYKQQ